MFGNKFKLQGHAEYFLDTSANSVKGRQFGQPKITYSNTKNQICYQYPTAVIHVNLVEVLREFID